MNLEFEEWRRTTKFSNKSFFDTYVRYLRSLQLSTKPSEYVFGFELKKTKTTPLMSRLNHTCAKESQYIDTLLIRIAGVCIVVIHTLPHKYSSISNQAGSWTMTELKQDGHFAFNIIDEDRTCKRMHWDDEKWLNIWSVPMHLRAVTNGDKDFRKEYIGGDLVYEGNEYGDTSDFYIIGTLTNKMK